MSFALLVTFHIAVCSPSVFIFAKERDSTTREKRRHLTINLDSSTRVGGTEAKGLKKEKRRAREEQTG